MSEDDKDGGIVRVSAVGPDAVPEPMFLIKHGDKYYISLAVWEYDLAEAKTEEQKEGYATVHDHFARHAHEAKSAAMTIPKGSPVAMTSTTKPPPPPQPVKPPKP